MAPISIKRLFFLISFFCGFNSLITMPAPEANEYYSDSEDEEGYTYAGIPALKLLDGKEGKECVALLRGIHFSPTKFTKEEISAMRKKDESGKDVFSSAAYDLANESLGSENKDDIKEKAEELSNLIQSLSLQDRHRFQEIYSNQYDKFHKQLGTKVEGGIFKDFESKKNPQVSTAENFYHANRYASGLKFLGKEVESLNPAYDANGKPKHPYLGKLYVILATIDQIKKSDPYFVVHGHANDDITISYHYSKNVLEEREVSFPGFVPGEAVVLSLPIRVPSFQGEYKPWYQEKFGISKRAYNARKKILTTGKYYKNETKDPEEIKQKSVKDLLEKIILPHVADRLKKHVLKECELKNIRVVYKDLDAGFSPFLPSIVNANNHKKLIKQQKENPAA